MSGEQRGRGETPERGGSADPMTIVAKPHTGLASRLRNYVLAGLLVVAPVSITLWLTWEFVSFVDDTLTPLIPRPWRPSTYLPIDIPGIGLIIAAVGLVLIGFLATGLIGRWFMREGERLVDRVPVVRSIYGALKQIFETVLAQRSNAFRQVVLVEYPCRGTWAIGFITGTTKGEVQRLTDETVVNVFVPATPNPSTGFLLFVPRSDVRLLDMTTEEAAKLIISGGIITPPVRAEPLPAAQAEPGAVAEADISTAIGENVLEEHLSEAEAEAGGPRRRRPFGLLARLRNYMLAGILVTAPISITIWLTWNVIAFVDARVTPFMPPAWNPESYLPFSIPGLGVLMVLLVLTLAGMFATGLLGRLVTSSYERLLNAVPVIRSVYGVTKQIFETVLAQRSNAFRQVVLIQYPRPDSWALAFVTADTAGDVARKAPDDSLNLFLPTTPNPTSGFLLFVPRREAHVLSMTVEEGAKMIISGGIITPEAPNHTAGGGAAGTSGGGAVAGEDPRTLAASEGPGRS
jgi:uncharacterized membrane protein